MSSFAAKLGLAATLIGALDLSAGFAVAQLPPAPEATQAGNHWVKDEQSGCSAPDPDFADGDGLVWSGACPNGVVDGPGTLTFTNKGRPQVTISGNFHNGDLLPGRASFAWPDGSRYDGEQTSAKFNGQGVFVSAQKDRLEGTWKDGALNGHAIVTWTNGNRYEGGWLNGEAEGHGVEIWANGDRYEGDWDGGKAAGHGVQKWANGQSYDGEWSNDQPNGTGKLIKADGATFTGKFIDGHPQGSPDVPARALAAADVTAAPSVAPGVATLSTASTDPSTPSRSRLSGMAGRKLLAIDGSSIALEESESGFTRSITKSDGATVSTAFTFVNERMGTVADGDDPSHVTGMFKMTDAEIDVDFVDGHSEVLKPGEGGVTLSMRTPDGRTSCMVWYPDGHAFSDAEKKIALAEYASKLGMTLKRADAKALAHSSGCTASLESTKPDSLRTRNSARPQPRALAASFEPPAALPAAVPASPPTARAGTIAVRSSLAQAIDSPKPVITAFSGGQTGTAIAAPPAVAPVTAVSRLPAAASPAATPPAAMLPQPSAPATTAAPLPSALAAYTPDTSDPGASNCLSVASDGSHWGFKNTCSFTVQFVYCLKGDGELLASCKDGAISGSAAPSSFSALVADASMRENNVDHQFRWVACSGGAGEVIPRLDGVDPPIGRCLRARTASN
ncbi:MAG: hypothetical protein ABSD74_02745 [Rhizomicrobium sp.]|jgi:hypothetical protein